MDSFARLRGRPFLLNQLMRPVTSGRVNHAQIFSGPAGIGKSGAALLVAKAVNCTGSGRKPCGKCPSCLRFAEGIPPCLSVIDPDGSSIRIEQIRDVIDDLMIRPESGMKCVIIHQADRMTQAAQNALLKTLEEPPEYALFMLITESYAALLPTIRSRCIHLRFAPLDERDVREILEEQGTDSETAAKAASASGGSPGKAFSIASDKEYNEIADKLFAAFEGLKTTRDVAQKCGAFRAIAGHSETILSILENCACEMMPAQNGAGGKMSPLAQRLNDNGIDGAELNRAVIKCASMTGSNVSFQNAFEMLLYDITTK